MSSYYATTWNADPKLVMRNHGHTPSTMAIIDDDPDDQVANEYELN